MIRKKKEKAASHLSNALSVGYVEELPLGGQYKQEAFFFFFLEGLCHVS